MPWVPTTNFEEEIVNLQPRHDFFDDVLSEPEHNYPRPQSHIEYVANKKKQYSGKKSAKLHAIAQVQRMANIKSLGEQPTVDDWESDEQIEQETIGMIRYHGMSLSVDQTFNEEVTIATYPVENTIKVIRNGRKKFVYFFDDRVFQLKESVPNSSRGIASSNCNDLENTNDSSASDIDCKNTRTMICNTSCSKAALPPSDSYGAVACSDAYVERHSKVLDQRLKEYQKLVENTSTLSLSCSCKTNTDNFKTAKNCICWKPKSLEDDEKKN